ncbi:hypothetical protein BU26DRAFT_184658 [Trematosphaeria pertusa]|uniref:Uncharacterized protein n=1 Tax=Trematosphaeria pertusa TaxID=390896 RepID=A0A6A6HTT6_9PLEO|nr:uncharacterized protein BU26DRAFT_184658 [Trematosphaeria pertusa]KAF2240943.1 hypothetical protein BU26DRAFT_184658 [Trematosphaeria pertusa]
MVENSLLRGLSCRSGSLSHPEEHLRQTSSRLTPTLTLKTLGLCTVPQPRPSPSTIFLFRRISAPAAKPLTCQAQLQAPRQALRNSLAGTPSQRRPMASSRNRFQGLLSGVLCALALPRTTDAAISTHTTSAKARHRVFICGEIPIYALYGSALRLASSSRVRRRLVGGERNKAASGEGWCIVNSGAAPMSGKGGCIKTTVRPSRILHHPIYCSPVHFLDGLFFLSSSLTLCLYLPYLLSFHSRAVSIHSLSPLL